MNPLPPTHDRQQVAGSRQREHEELSRDRRRPAPPVGDAQQEAAAEADADADRNAEPQLGRRLDEPVRQPRSLRGGEGQREDHERCGDPVVQATLGIEQATDPRGDRPVRDDRLTECRVGRCESGADEQRDPERDAREQQEGPHCPQDDGEQQPHHQQPCDGPRVTLERARTDGRGVREEQERQGRLCEDPDRLRLGLERDVTEGVVGDEDADDHERECRSHRQTVESCGDKA